MAQQRPTTATALDIRMNQPRMPALVVAHRRPGFYFRVLQEGEVGTGDDIVKLADGPERITVADIDALNNQQLPSEPAAIAHLARRVVANLTADRVLFMGSIPIRCTRSTAETSTL